MCIFNAVGSLKKGKQVIGNKIIEEYDRGQAVVIE